MRHPLHLALLYLGMRSDTQSPALLQRPFSAPSAQLDMPTGSDSPQLSLALAVDATSAGAAAAGAWAAKRLPRPCFNGGQVWLCLPFLSLACQHGMDPPVPGTNFDSGTGAAVMRSI